MKAHWFFIAVVLIVNVCGRVTAAQEIKNNNVKVEILNVKSSYKESEAINPTLKNVGTRAIFLQKNDGAIDTSIFSYDKAIRNRNMLLTNLRCGNETIEFLEIKPGEQL